MCYVTLFICSIFLLPLSENAIYFDRTFRAAAKWKKSSIVILDGILLTFTSQAKNATPISKGKTVDIAIDREHISALQNYWF